MARSSNVILILGVGLLTVVICLMVLFDKRFESTIKDPINQQVVSNQQRRKHLDPLSMPNEDSMEYKVSQYRQLNPISCNEPTNIGTKCGAVIVVMPPCYGYYCQMAISKRNESIFNYLMLGKNNSHPPGQVYSNPDVIYFYSPNSTISWRTNDASFNNMRFEPLPFPLSEAHLNRFWFVDFLRVVGNYDWVLRLDADVELMSDGTASITDLISKSESGRDLPLLSSIAWRDYRFRESVIDAVSLITNYTKTHMCHYGFTVPVLSAALINVQKYRDSVNTKFLVYGLGIVQKPASIEGFIDRVKQDYGSEYWSPEILWGGLHALPTRGVGGYLNFSMRIGSILYDSSNNSMDTLDMLKMYSLWSHTRLYNKQLKDNHNRRNRLSDTVPTYVSGRLINICV